MRVNERAGSIGLTLAFALFSFGSLFYFAGPWAVLANTRLLDLLINSGVIKYHDRGAGFVEGVADPVYFMKSQEPVIWLVVGLAVVFILVSRLIKAFQYHQIAQHLGLPGAFRHHARAVFTGRAEGRERSPDVWSLFRFFLVFEIAVYALAGLFGAGWSSWLIQMLWGLIVFGVMYWWTRPASRPEGGISPVSAAWAQVRELAGRPALFLRLCLLSVAAFGLLDVAAYLVTMSFSTIHVLLHVDFSILLMAFVAGYIARLLPLTPGGVGQFEWGFTGALFLGGMGLPEAATVALLFSFFYYVSLGLLYLISLGWRSFPEEYAATNGDEKPAGAPAEEARPAPAPFLLWKRALVFASVILGVFFFDRLAALLSNLWLLDSIGLREVFNTNFSTGAGMFIAGALMFAAAGGAPALFANLPRETRRFVWGLAGFAGLLAAYRLSLRYEDVLLWRNGLPFGENDPVFNKDIGFYVFSLPGWRLTLEVLTWAFGVALVSSAICAWLGRRQSGAGVFATMPVLVSLGGLGTVLAASVWIGRYDLLLKEDKLTSVFTGASYLDINGLFSTLNQIKLNSFVIIGVTIFLIVLLRSLRRQKHSAIRMAGTGVGALILADFLFAFSVSVRNTALVTPNQPVIQLPYIERHIAATRKAFGLDKVQEIEFVPRTGADPLPALDSLLSSSTIRNAPLWPPFVNYLEQLVDPQHAQRILQTGGDDMIYGPSLEIFQQQEKLRTYYDFLDVDVLRFSIDGEKRVLAGSVRELPILEPQPWLAWWGQRFMLFTHGHGLVMAPVGETTDQGEPVFVSGQIPVQAAWPELTVANQQVYYGEGNAGMAVSNVRDMAELDYPTAQGRAENVLPADFPAGVQVNSLIKRIVFGWQSGEFWEMIFSSLITRETRLHIHRQPLKRLEQIAPFLYFESDPYATVVNGDITWLVNAVTASDQYPYSKHEFIGDKSLSRTPDAIRTERINYVEDAVKATINAASGQVKLYKIADQPVINTWAAVYPSLFAGQDQMPGEVRQQLTYPLQLFHILFDDLYIYYHMNDPVYFFNMEDMWDDADEVLGPVLDKGKAITFSMEPYHMLLKTGGLLPAAVEQEQFVMALPFTPEGARNLRAMPLAYQDGPDYGRLFVLSVPKGMFVMGPEQADAIIDQDPNISQQISWWNRLGTEVIRGHTSLLLVEDEVIYIEPIFIRSQQNSIPQLKRVIAVIRGHAYMAENLEEALRQAYAKSGSDLAGPVQRGAETEEGSASSGPAGGASR